MIFFVVDQHLSLLSLKSSLPRREQVAYGDIATKVLQQQLDKNFFFTEME